MASTSHRVRLCAVVLAACAALPGCALQSSQSPAAGGTSPPTASDGWRYARTITLDTTAAGASVADDVENYPLAVLLDKSRFDFGQARANGADIRFVDAGGKALPHAIELWDRESGAAAIWVLLERVKGNSRDQSIVMRWGHSSAPDTSDSKSVFKRADGFVGAWHLGEDGNTDPDGYKDSSEHEAHGTGVGLTPGSRVGARIGRGTHLDNPAGQDTARWIRVPGEKAKQFNPGPPITVSIWALGYPIPFAATKRSSRKATRRGRCSVCSTAQEEVRKKSPARAIKPACGRLGTICARTTSPGRGSSRKSGCTSWWSTKNRA